MLYIDSETNPEVESSMIKTLSKIVSDASKSQTGSTAETTSNGLQARSDMAIVNLETIMEGTQPEKESESLAFEADWHHQIKNHKIYFIDYFTRDKSHRQTENFSAFSFLRDQYLSSLASRWNFSMEKLKFQRLIVKWKTRLLMQPESHVENKYHLLLSTKQNKIVYVRHRKSCARNQFLLNHRFCHEAKSLKLYIIEQMKGVGSNDFLQGTKVFTLLISYTLFVKIQPGC